MEAADSICYLVMDIEDGYKKRYISYDQLREFLYGLEGLATKIQQLENDHKGPGHEIAIVVNLRIHLIGVLARRALENFRNNYDAICAGTYQFELIKDDTSKLADKLMTFCTDKIFSHREICSLELSGHSVLNGLLEYFTDTIINGDTHYKKRGISLISESIMRVALLENGLPEKSFENLSNYYKLRVIVDYITGMTDQFAVDQFQKLSGQKII
jgi:dGTPase